MNYRVNMNNNNESYYKTNKNKDLTIEKKVVFFNNDKEIKKTTFEKKDFHKKIVEFCKGKKITHIQINGFELSINSILIKKKIIKEKPITGNLFKFVNMDLKIQAKM